MKKKKKNNSRLKKVGKKDLNDDKKIGSIKNQNPMFTLGKLKWFLV